VQDFRHRLGREDVHVVGDNLGDLQFLRRRVPFLGQVIAAAGEREEDLDAAQHRIAGAVAHIKRPEPRVDLVGVHLQQAARKLGGKPGEGGFEQAEVGSA